MCRVPTCHVSRATCHVHVCRASQADLSGQPRAIVVPPCVRHMYLPLPAGVKLRRSVPVTAAKRAAARRNRPTLKEKRAAKARKQPRPQTRPRAQA